MTRTEYCNRIREAGFRVSPVWQASTKDNTTGWCDVTCYAVHTARAEFVTHMILREVEIGEALDVFFESPNVRVSGDIDQLRRLARPGVAA